MENLFDNYSLTFFLNVWKQLLLLTFTFPDELRSSYNGLANEALAVSSSFLEKSSKQQQNHPQYQTGCQRTKQFQVEKAWVKKI